MLLFISKPDLTMYLIVSAVIYGAIVVAMYCVKCWPQYRLAFSLPGPKAVPIFGNALMFLQKDRGVPEILNTIFQSYSSPSRAWLGPHVEFFINDADQMKAIFLSDKMVEKHYSYSFLRSLGGTGLVTAPAERWIAYRKLIAPTLNAIRVRSFLPVFCKQAKLLLERIETEVDGPEFDVLHHFSVCTFSTISGELRGSDVFYEAAFGIEQDSASQSLAEYDRAFNVVGAILKRLIPFWFLPNSIFDLTPAGKELKRNIDFCRNFAMNIVQQKKREYRGQSNGLHESVDADNNPPKKKAVLDLLLEVTRDGCELSDDELVDQVVTLIVAGYETNATTSSFALLLLASYPDVQEKVYQELREIYQDDLQRDITHEDTQRMEYMDRVIRETMRLFPPGHIVGRQAMADVNIGTCTLPTGASVLLGIASMHRNPKYWPNPLKFDPDRFSPEEVAQRHPYCYLPFLAGPRNCPGSKYAIVSMKVTLAMILRRYVVKKNVIPAIEDIKLAAHILLRPVEKITVRIERRL